MAKNPKPRFRRQNPTKELVIHTKKNYKTLQDKYSLLYELAKCALIFRYNLPLAFSCVYLCVLTAFQAP